MNGGQSGYPPPGGQWPSSPYGGGSGYGDQGSYGPPPYGNTQPSPYGAGQGPWSYGPGGGPPPPKKSRAGLIIALVIAGVVVIGGGATALVAASSGDDKPSPTPTAAASSPSSSPSTVQAGGQHSIVLPESVGPYHHLTGSVADRLASTMRKAMGDSQGQYAEAYSKAKIAIYSKNGDTTHALIFVGLSGSDSPSIANELQSRSSSEEVDATFLGMGIGDAKDYPPGPLGGVLRCGTGPLSGNSAAACAWADSSTLGALIVPGTSDTASLAGTTLDLRNAAER